MVGVKMLEMIQILDSRYWILDKNRQRVKVEMLDEGCMIRKLGSCFPNLA
jgi:pyruvate dehydrogenase complex dehydrogenase (E1) component